MNAQIEIREVYHLKNRVLVESGASLDPEGERLFLVRGLEVEVHDWKMGTFVTARPFLSIPCTTKPEFRAWLILPRQQSVLSAYCDAIYLLSLPNLNVSRKVFDVDRSISCSLAVSNNGKLVGAISRRQQGGQPLSRVTVLDTATWEVLVDWNLSERYVRDLSFDEEGKLVALGWSSNVGGRTGVDVREVRSGLTLADWSIVNSGGNYEGYISDPRFVPKHPESVATRCEQSFEPFSVCFWDWKVGHLTKRIPLEGSELASVCLSPDLKWAFGSVANGPDDTRFTQEFLVWELASGNLLYQSRKRKWSPIDLLIYLATLREPERASFTVQETSADGRLLLVRTFKSIRLYQVRFH